MQGLARLSIGSLLAGLLLLAGGMVWPNGLLWFQAHGVVILVGSVLPALALWHNHSYTKFTRSPPSMLVAQQTAAYSATTVLMGAGTLLQPSAIFSIVVLIGFATFLVAAIMSLRIHMACKPEGSLVDIEADPLTKGDDASFKHLKMAHFFFPLGILLTAFPFFPYLSNAAWAQGLHIGGLHLIGIGYGLLSLYGIGHLWVPRFSGIPAIAAGAIKGELHSTMPAMIFLPIGFATGLKGFIIAGGAFAFLGFFTYMGVLGANIMKNKSPTHRVTPEFVYIPWTFTAIFWLVSAVIMGIFLNAVPDLLADIEGGLSSIHVHMALFGGFIQFSMGWLTRVLPGEGKPPRFAGAMSGSFYLFNIALAGALWYVVNPTLGIGLASIGALVASLVAYFVAMQGFMTVRSPRTD